MAMEIEEKALNRKAVNIWLAEQDKNQCDLAREIGMANSYLSVLMRGKMRLTGDVLLKIAGHTGIEPKKLVVAFVGDVMGKGAKKRKAKRRAAVPELQKATVARKKVKR